MAWKIYPHLEKPDWKQWQKYFPRGVGTSAFSSPAWQRLMCREMNPEWELFFLTSHGENKKPCSMPIFARRGRWNRIELTVRPIAYYVLPIEEDQPDERTIATMLEPVRAFWTAGFTWWLPPWLNCRLDHLDRSSHPGKLNISSYNTYLITIDDPAEDYLKRFVSQTQVRHLRTSYRNGIEVLENPSRPQVEEYDRLYLQVWTDDKWVGPRFPPGFFHGVAETMDEGGRLVLMRYQDRIVGGGVVLFDHNAVHYFQGTIDRYVHDVYPHCVLYELLLRYAQERGLRYVNLGGVNPGNEGLVRFKMAWGGKEVKATILRWRYDGPPWARKSLHWVEQRLRPVPRQEPAHADNTPVGG